ncbi:unnamed protein product [Rhizophagus irregularis]|nr:unnamed protein product [Rhizophagus irregularis]
MQQKVKKIYLSRLVNIIITLHLYFYLIEEQEVYHSIQFDFDLQDGIITEVKEEFNKRSYFNVEGQDDLTINPKKVRLNNNNYKGYLKLDDDKIYNPNFHLEEQDELKVSDCKMDLNYYLLN